MMSLTFLELYTVYRNIGQFIFHIYWLTCLNKNTSVVLVIKAMVLTFLKNIMYMPTIPLTKLPILEKEKYSLHTIACLTVFTRQICHMRFENLLKWPDLVVEVMCLGPTSNHSLLIS